MKYAFLIFVFIVGVIVGVQLFSGHHAVSGAAVADCFVNNEPCACSGDSCLCGNETVASSYCTQTLNSGSR